MARFDIGDIVRVTRFGGNGIRYYVIREVLEVSFSHALIRTEFGNSWVLYKLITKASIRVYYEAI